MNVSAGSGAAPGWVHAWEAAERGSAPRAGLAAGPPHALWFLALWHLLRVWTWTWGGAGSESGDEAVGGGWAVSGAASGAVCGPGLEAGAGLGAEGDLGDRWTGKEDGFVSALGGA